MKPSRYIYLCLCVAVLTLYVSYTGYTDQGGDASMLRVRVLTYNIYGGRNTDQKRDLDRIASVIRTLDPDIVALQEVDRHTGRINGVDLAAELGERLGMAHIFGRAMKYDGGEYGEAILSKFPIEDVTHHGLPTVPLPPDSPELQEVEPRVVLAAKVKFPDADRSFIFMATHLDHLRDPSNKIVQAGALNDIARTYTGMPLILAGDLNAAPDSEPLAILGQFWRDAWPATKEVFAPGSRRNRRIDYVMLAPEKSWRVVDTYRGTEINRNDNAWQELLTLASDHLPVIAELELQAP